MLTMRPFPSKKWSFMGNLGITSAKVHTMDFDHTRCNSGKAGHYPLFLSSQNQKGEKRAAIAEQGHDYDLILLSPRGKLLGCSALSCRSISGWNQAKWIYISTCLQSYCEKQPLSPRAVQAVLCLSLERRQVPSPCSCVTQTSEFTTFFLC